MNTAAEILVIIVSAVLAIFLLVLIIAVVKIIQILRTVRHIVERAEKIADSAESIGAFFRHSTGPLALTKVVANIVESVVKHKQGKGDK